MGKFTPLFRKDGDTYAVPSPSLLFDTPEEAVAGGAAAGLSAGYGLTATGESVELQDESNSFPGPFLIASVGNLRAWIVGGPSLDALVETRNVAVENLPEERTVAKNPAFAAPYGAAESEAPASLTQGDHTGSEV